MSFYLIKREIKISCKKSQCGAQLIKEQAL